MTHEHGDTNAHFDERAASWDEDRSHVDRAEALAASIRTAVPLRSDLRVLEYGAGTGLVAQQLVGEVGPLTLADPSEGMRAVLARKVDEGVFGPDTTIWDVDLATTAPPEATVDLVVTAMTLHHIEDVPAVLRAFAGLLAPGGTAAVADLVAEDGSFHDSPDFHAHNGFDPDEFSGWLREAGFTDVSLRHAVDIEREDRSFPVFLITATRQ